MDEPDEEWPENCCDAWTDDGWSDSDCETNSHLFCEGPLQI